MGRQRVNYVFSLKYIKLYLFVKDLLEVIQFWELMSLDREICQNKKVKRKRLLFGDKKY